MAAVTGFVPPIGLFGDGPRSPGIVVSPGLLPISCPGLSGEAAFGHTPQLWSIRLGRTRIGIMRL